MCETNEKDQRNIAVDNEVLRSKYLLMQYEWRCQQEKIGRLEIEMTKLHSQLKHQAQFCSMVGSVLGARLWDATQLPQIVNMVLQENKMLRLSQIMIGVLSSFVNTYPTKLSIVDTDEIQFVRSILGLVLNLATVNEGRQFFLQTENGKNVIQLILNIVPRIPSPSGNKLKKILYGALYNISIHSNGSSQITNDKLVSTLNNDIKDDDKNLEPDLRLFALKLLGSLTYNIHTKATYTVLKNNIELSRVIKLASAVDVETETTARSLLDDFSKATEQFETKIIMS